MTKWGMKNQHHWASYYQDNLYCLLIIDDEIRKTYDIPESSFLEIKEIMMDALLYQKFNIVDYLRSKRLY